MAGGFRVKAAAVVLPTEDGSERYLYRSGAILPTRGYTVEGLKHAASLGLIEKAELPKVDGEQDGGEQSQPAGTTGSPAPEEPRASWPKDKLEAFAAEHSIDLGEASNNEERFAAIQAAIAAKATQA